jgi:hypothetical protein
MGKGARLRSEPYSEHVIGGRYLAPSTAAFPLIQYNKSMLEQHFFDQCCALFKFKSAASFSRAGHRLLTSFVCHGQLSQSGYLSLAPILSSPQLAPWQATCHVSFANAKANAANVSAKAHFFPSLSLRSCPELPSFPIFLYSHSN